MKTRAWYDPTNRAVSRDKDSPLFTPLGQLLPLYTQRTWVGLTDEEITQIIETGLNIRDSIETALDKLKEKNT